MPPRLRPVQHMLNVRAPLALGFDFGHSYSRQTLQILCLAWGEC